MRLDFVTHTSRRDIVPMFIVADKPIDIVKNIVGHPSTALV